jgi:UDP-N-acetylglucosamine 2-epimerase
LAVKVVSIVGARPQFIKAVALSRALRREHHEVLVHTGQHYDEPMSQAFFDELGLPEPDYRLGVGSGSHGQQTGRMLERVEEVLLRERPGWALVYGDTNSTLAGALAAAKLGIRLAHVEAGLRSGDRRLPEEINRVLADHCSDLLFCPTPTAVTNLNREGIRAGVHLVGDVMYDSLLQHLPLAEEKSDALERLGVSSGVYYLATIHRAANTDDPARLADILEGLRRLHGPVVFPVHPRTRKAAEAASLAMADGLLAVDPVGYGDMLVLEKNARCVLTDSGGVQKEAYLLAVPCVTLREETEWPETLEGGWNILAGTDPERIVSAATRPAPEGRPALCFGDGRAAERIVRVLEDDPSHG